MSTFVYVCQYVIWSSDCKLRNSLGGQYFLFSFYGKRRVSEGCEVTVFVQLTGDIHEEVESHNKLLDGMVRNVLP